MTSDVRWMPRARRQAAEAQQWWIENRELAPTMFLDELARVIALLQADPHLGIRVQGREIRRILLPDTKRFLYYRVRPRARRIEIVAVWGAVRELGPLCRPIDERRDGSRKRDASSVHLEAAFTANLVRLLARGLADRERPHQPVDRRCRAAGRAGARDLGDDSRADLAQLVALLGGQPMAVRRRALRVLKALCEE